VNAEEGRMQSVVTYGVESKSEILEVWFDETSLKQLVNAVERYLQRE